MTSRSFFKSMKVNEKMDLKRKSDILVTENGKSTYARIQQNPENKEDCLDVVQKKSNKTKGTYDVFKLFVVHEGSLKEIPNLFNKDLNNLIDTYGSHTPDWIGLPIKVTCNQEGDYFRYKIEATKEFEEEELK